MRKLPHGGTIIISEGMDIMEAVITDKFCRQRRLRRKVSFF
jgi:hypothetical protein